MLNEKNQIDKYIIFGTIFQFNLIDKYTYNFMLMVHSNLAHRQIIKLLI